MDRFHIEIVAAPDAAHHVATLQTLIQSDAALSVAADPWTRRVLPRQADLYAMLVVVSPGLASAGEIAQRVRQVSRNGFPVIPIVENVKDFRFDDAPLEEIRRHNAEGLNNPERLIQSLLHHAGLRLFEAGGRVFISHARIDGERLADALRDEFMKAGIRPFVDRHAIAGGELVQEDIEDRIHNSDLVLLIDTEASALSEWVSRELDMATGARVPVIAVIPHIDSPSFQLDAPHVRYRTIDEIAPAVLSDVRRLLGRKDAFRRRVSRVLKRLADLRAWRIDSEEHRWRLRWSPNHLLHVECVDGAPALEHVVKLRTWCAPSRGLLVAGVRPLPRRTAEGLLLAEHEDIRVTPLSTLAAGIPGHLSGGSLRGKRIFLSAAMPSQDDDVLLARDTLRPFIAALTQSLIELGATLVFGGHPSVSPLIHECIRSLVRVGSGAIELHQARSWQGAAATVPLEVREGPVFRSPHWHGSGADPVADLIALRDAMIDQRLDAAVFVGGKTEGYVGEPRGMSPGVIDEHCRFVLACPDKPAFVVGLAGGAARHIQTDGSQILDAIASTADPDLAVALIIAELLGP